LFAWQVHYNPDLTGPRDLISAVDDAGFEATLAVARCGSGVDQTPDVVTLVTMLDIVVKGHAFSTS
jgi:Holliday junction resolvase